MSRIAQATGVHRATLYRYFEDVDELLVAYYSRQTARYLAVLTAAKETWDVGKALSAVVETYALIAHEHHASPIARLVHERIDRILVPSELSVRRQIIWRNWGRRLAERWARPGVDVMRRACGAASADVRWFVA